MPLLKYTASNVKGYNGLEILIDEDFKPYADLMNETAARHGIEIIVIDSKRESTVVAGAVFDPATHGNHLIGQAWDVNLRVISTGAYWNHDKLLNPTGVIKFFIDDVKDGGLRWGGDFHPDRKGRLDTVHLDSGLNVRAPLVYQKKYNEYFPPQPIAEVPNSLINNSL